MRTPVQYIESIGEKLRYRYDLNFRYQASPFGAEYQEAWNHRYELFSEFDRGIKTDAVGLYSVTPEKTAREIAVELKKRSKTRSIIDAFCGIGGCAIAFAQQFENVYALDLDAGRLEMAKHNARVYGLENITFMQGNFLEQAGIFGAETVFLDPPWGGPSFSDNPAFTLNDFTPDGHSILAVAFKYFSVVALRVPEKFDLSELNDYKFDIKPNFLEGRIISKTVYFNA